MTHEEPDEDLDNRPDLVSDGAETFTYPHRHKSLARTPRLDLIKADDRPHQTPVSYPA